MTDEELAALQAANREFVATHIGCLLARFEHAHSVAWITDQREGASPKAMSRDWDASDTAYKLLKDAIKAIQAERNALRDAGDRIVALVSRCSDQATPEQAAEHLRNAESLQAIWIAARASATP